MLRRDFLKACGVGVGTASLSGWLPTLAARADADGRRSKSCILLWMTGGPSHLDTFDLKPEARSEVRGEFRPIATAIAGIQISEHFPRFARLLRHAAIIRGMSTPEVDHQLASYHLHTGYQNRAGGASFPALGAIASQELGRGLGRGEFPLPNYAVIGPGPQDGTQAGFLGPRHQPLRVPEPARGVENLSALVDGPRFQRQFQLLGELERSFYQAYQAPAGQAHTTMLQSAVRMMRARESQAFDLAREPEAVRGRYGRTSFGQGCLLARRLVEAGVPFVEVNMGLGNDGWDTHTNNFPRTRTLSAQVDPAMSALVEDLRDRGLLERTLVIWMGEFGRTPQITSGGGRNHHARAWSTVLAGGGIHGGQVIGRTDRDAATVTDRPVSVVDFMATLCRILGIDYTRNNESPDGRPVRIVDNRNVNPIAELFP
jgi:hypothetical protein